MGWPLIHNCSLDSPGTSDLTRDNLHGGPLQREEDKKFGYCGSLFIIIILFVNWSVV